MAAAQEGQLEVVRELLKSGAVSKALPSGLTASAIATAHSEGTIATMLQRAEACV